MKTPNLNTTHSCLSHALQEMELAIMATPSGEFRNGLTEINMCLMSAESVLVKNGHAALGMFPFPKAEEPPPYPYTDEEETEGLNRMKMMGGGFARALAEAWFRADGGNQAKLREQFAGILAPYVNQFRNGQ